MTMGPTTLTVGWISRHTPPGAGVDGRDAAVIDIAQDLLLRDLHEEAAPLQRRPHRRASTCRRHRRNDYRTVHLRRDRTPEQVAADDPEPIRDGRVTLSSKLDVSPPPWLEPVRRGWVRMPIHATQRGARCDRGGARAVSS